MFVVLSFGVTSVIDRLLPDRNRSTPNFVYVSLTLLGSLAIQVFNSPICHNVYYFVHEIDLGIKKITLM